jgi:hypothetical protein
VPTITTTTVICDRCRRTIPSGATYPILAGPAGITQILFNVCEDLPNNCRALCTAVIFGPISEIPLQSDALVPNVR